MDCWLALISGVLGCAAGAAGAGAAGAACAGAARVTRLGARTSICGSGVEFCCDVADGGGGEVVDCCCDGVPEFCGAGVPVS